MKLKSIQMAIFITFIGCSASDVGTLRIINNTPKVVSQLTVDVCGQSFEYRDISPDNAIALRYEKNCEGHFRLFVAYNDGKTLRDDIGYVTPGINIEHEIAIGLTGFSLASEGE